MKTRLYNIRNILLQKGGGGGGRGFGWPHIVKVFHFNYIFIYIFRLCSQYKLLLGL